MTVDRALYLLIALVLAIIVMLVWLGVGKAFAAEGTASWYGGHFIGRKTASGEVFHGSTCATSSYRAGQKPYMVTIKNLSNGRIARCRVNDRMSANGRIIDVGVSIAERLGFKNAGLAKVRVTR